MKQPKDFILTAGPSISQKEISYVIDAVKNGWNSNWNNYLLRFEQAFADYIGVKYAMSTSSCTGAMHLSLLALGIGKGDEVIVPDLTWVATASTVKYTGAEPVLVDVSEDTWCLDPEKIEQAITKKTKAIMPVHLYGNVCEMNKINVIAKKHGLHVVEDAAQSIGAFYHGKRPGSFGDFGCFSFQGAKIMVTGEGGMLVTNSKELYQQAKFYNDHARDPKGSFMIFDVGYKYKMSNIQAALGLAQLERIEIFVNRKRSIYKRYHSKLKNLDVISLNIEPEETKNNYWMTSIILKGILRKKRDLIMKELKKRMIDSRTFFYPISGFKPYTKRFPNIISKHLSEGGINLPSGVNLKNEQVDYISEQIIEILS